MMGIFGKKHRSEDSLCIWIEHRGLVIYELEARMDDDDDEYEFIMRRYVEYVENDENDEEKPPVSVMRLSQPVEEVVGDCNIIIGRDNDATWRLTGIDDTVSGRHALLNMRQGKFYLSDLGSKNGIFRNGKKIGERELKNGDEITIGNSLFIVQRKQGKVSESKSYRLEYTDENGRTVRKELRDREIVIGSGRRVEGFEPCGIAIHDKMISGRHALLTLKDDGSYWIRDLGSRYGTRVNNNDLGPDDEFRLREQDVITLGTFLDLTYLSGNVDDGTATPLFRALTIVIVTAVLAVGAVLLAKNYIAKPIEERIKFVQQELLPRGDYAKARSELQDAKKSSDTNSQKLAIDNLLNEIDQIESTRVKWEKAVSCLNPSSGDLAEARRWLDEALPSGYWAWPNADIEYNKAAAAKKLLSVYFSTTDIIASDSFEYREIERILPQLKDALTASTAFVSESYINVLRERVSPLVVKMDALMGHRVNMDKALLALGKDTPDYAEAIELLESLSRESVGNVKNRTDKLLLMVKSLRRETIRVESLDTWVGDMKFKDTLNFRLGFDETMDWTGEATVKDLRRKLETQVANIQKTARDLALVIGGLEAGGICLGGQLPDIDAFLDAEKMNGVYSYDCFKLPLPSNFRKKPSGIYDEMLGIEYFHGYVSRLDINVLRPDADPELFRCRLYSCHAIMSKVEAAMSFFRNLSGQWSGKGRLAEFISYCQSILDKRDAIIASQLARNDQPGSRDFLVSRGIALYLSPETGSNAVLLAEVKKGFEIYRKKMKELRKGYLLATPEEQIRIREKIFGVGLPGDSELRSKWKQHLKYSQGS